MVGFGGAVVALAGSGGIVSGVVAGECVAMNATNTHQALVAQTSRSCATFEASFVDIWMISMHVEA